MAVQCKSCYGIFEDMDALRIHLKEIDEDGNSCGSPNINIKQEGTTESQNYLKELLRGCLIKDGVKNAIVLNTWEEKVDKLSPEKLVEELMTFSPTINISPIENYIQAIKIKTLETSESVKYEVGTEIKNAFLPPLHKLKADGKTFVSIATDLDLSYEQIKNALRTLLPTHFNPNTNVFPSELLLPFIVSKEQCLSGQVISNLDGAKKSVTLITVFSLSGKFIYQFFGETKPHECKKLAPFFHHRRSIA